MNDGVSTQPPTTDAFVWYREDRVKQALLLALERSIETHGEKAKSVAWDVNAHFTEIMRG